MVYVFVDGYMYEEIVCRLNILFGIVKLWIWCSLVSLKECFV